VTFCFPFPFSNSVVCVEHYSFFFSSFTFAECNGVVRCEADRYRSVSHRKLGINDVMRCFCLTTDVTLRFGHRNYAQCSGVQVSVANVLLPPAGRCSPDSDAEVLCTFINTSSRTPWMEEQRSIPRAGLEPAIPMFECLAPHGHRAWPSAVTA